MSRGNREREKLSQPWKVFRSECEQVECRECWNLNILLEVLTNWEWELHYFNRLDHARFWWSFKIESLFNNTSIDALFDDPSVSSFYSHFYFYPSYWRLRDQATNSFIKNVRYFFLLRLNISCLHQHQAVVEWCEDDYIYATWLMDDSWHENVWFFVIDVTWDRFWLLVCVMELLINANTLICAKTKKNKDLEYSRQIFIPALISI